MEIRGCVSVVMNCLNGESFVHEAIQSVLNQTYKNFEIIFWDNSSTDKTAEIVKSIKDSRLKYFKSQKQTKLYEARNLAFQECGGEYIAFLDVDDLWDEKKLENQIKLFDNKAIGFVCSGYEIVNERQFGKKFFVIPEHDGQVLTKLLENYFIGLLTLVVRKSVLVKLSGPFNPSYHIIGDFDLCIRMAKLSHLGISKKVLGKYRLHNKNESAQKRMQHVIETRIWIIRNSVIRRDVGPIIFSNFIRSFRFYGCLVFILEGRLDLAKLFFCKKFSLFQKLKLGIILVLPKSILLKIKK